MSGAKAGVVVVPGLAVLIGNIIVGGAAVVAAAAVAAAAAAVAIAAAAVAAAVVVGAAAVSAGAYCIKKYKEKREQIKCERAAALAAQKSALQSVMTFWQNRANASTASVPSDASVASAMLSSANVNSSSQSDRNYRDVAGALGRVSSSRPVSSPPVNRSGAAATPKTSVLPPDTFETINQLIKEATLVFDDPEDKGLLESLDRTDTPEEVARYATLLKLKLAKINSRKQQNIEKAQKLKTDIEQLDKLCRSSVQYKEYFEPTLDYLTEVCAGREELNPEIEKTIADQISKATKAIAQALLLQVARDMGYQVAEVSTQDSSAFYLHKADWSAGNGVRFTLDDQLKFDMQVRRGQGSVDAYSETAKEFADNFKKMQDNMIPSGIRIDVNRRTEPAAEAIFPEDKNFPTFVSEDTASKTEEVNDTTLSGRWDNGKKPATDSNYRTRAIKGDN